MESEHRDEHCCSHSEEEGIAKEKAAAKTDDWSAVLVDSPVADYAIESFLDLPDLCQMQVFKFLSIASLSACQLTCHSWNYMIKQRRAVLPKRQLERLMLNFTDKKASLEWLPVGKTFSKYRTFEFEVASDVSSFLRPFRVRRCQLIGAGLPAVLPLLNMREQKVQMLECFQTVVAGADDAAAVQRFIVQLGATLQRLCFKSNCDFGAALLDDALLAALPLEDIKELTLDCKSAITARTLDRFDLKKLTSLDVMENAPTLLAFDRLFDAFADRAPEEPKFVLWIKEETAVVTEALLRRKLTVAVENASKFWTDLVVCKGACIVAVVRVSRP